MPLQVNDIVRIAKQPPNQWAHIEGEVGWIAQIQDEYAQIQTLRLDGAPGGCGSVPLSCLVPEPGTPWREAKEKRDAVYAKLITEGQKHTARWNELVERVAKKHEIPTEKAQAIFKELSDFFP